MNVLSIWLQYDWEVINFRKCIDHGKQGQCSEFIRIYKNVFIRMTPITSFGVICVREWASESAFAFNSLWDIGQITQLLGPLVFATKSYKLSSSIQIFGLEYFELLNLDDFLNNLWCLLMFIHLQQSRVCTYFLTPLWKYNLHTINSYHPFKLYNSMVLLVKIPWVG